ncbi:MAG: hypothetical protein QMD23_00770, partial [Candidatus Bathyarchaeia archaeon]|nr:hypothetical protein [Candidatus Bathyarchaeia archaeon]
MKPYRKTKPKLELHSFSENFAHTHEECVYRLLRTKIHIPKPLQLFWGEKCLVWRKGGKEYALKFDVSIGKKTNNFVEPVMVLEAKVELDSARLKTALASFAILKQWNSEAECTLLYVTKEIDSTLLELANYWVDGIFQFNLKNDETTSFFFNYVARCWLNV